MKLAIVQIGDIHIKDVDNPVLQRANSIASAVRAETIDAPNTLLAVTGDVAYSGTPEEYLRARDFFTKLQLELQSVSGTKLLTTIAIPGNHDCNFDEEGEVRPALLEMIADRIENLDPSGEIAQQLTKVQSPFFGFEAWLTHGPELPLASRLAWSREIPCDGQSVRVNCYNTAWISRINERPGEMFFPSQAVVTPADAHLTVSLFHHPTAWLEPNNARLFRNAVESTSDLIMTGHEHAFGVFEKRELDSESVQHYIEGGALCGESGDDSGFSVVIVDTDQRTYEVVKFEWNGALYQPRRFEPREFVRQRRGLQGRIRNNSGFVATLNEPGTGFRHPFARILHLSDLYVYPDLTWVMPTAKKSHAMTVRTDDVLDFFREHKKVVVMGDHDRGKTALAKILYAELNRTLGVLPVLVCAEDLTGVRGKDVRRAIRTAFAEQYDERDWDAYLQLPPTQKMVIFDNWDRIRFNARGQARILAGLNAEYERIVCFTSELFQMAEIAEPDAHEVPFAEYDQCFIRELGRKHRGRLIQKWHSLGREYTLDARDFNHEVAASEKKMDTLLGKNLLPSVPIVVLTALQLDLDVQATSNTGSYGHIYEALLTQALAGVSGKPTDIGTKYTYISRIAYFLYREDRQSLTTQELHKIHEDYCERYQIRLSEAEMISDLVQAQIIARTGTSYAFKYSYGYYYFVAKYFQENLPQGDGVLRAQLLDIADKVNFDDYANILIFYLYLTNDGAIIEHILLNAAQIFHEVAPAELDGDVHFINRLLIEPAKKIVLPPIDIQANREEYRRLQDEDDESEAIAPRKWGKVSYGDGLEDMVKLNIALKHLRIMGQVLRNFPGVLKGDIKVRLTTECYSLGLRVIAALLGLAEANLEELRKYMAEMIRVRRGIETPEQLGKSADEALIWITKGVAFGIIKRISYAVGLEDLELTYARVREIQGAQKPAIRLIDLSIKFDHFREAPEKDVYSLDDLLHENAFAHSVLRSLVVDYLYLYCSNLRLAQKLGSRLDIDTSKTIFLTEKKFRLLPKPASE